MNFHLIESAQGYQSVSPLPSSEELGAFYANLYYQNSVAKTYSHSYSPLEIRQKYLHSELLILAGLSEIEQAQSSKDTRNNFSFLEIGCGEGFTLKVASERGWNILGSDFSLDGIDRHHPELKDFVCAGDSVNYLKSIANAGKNFDLIIAKHILEHVIDPLKVLTLMRDVMKPGGRLVLEVPNDGSRLQEFLEKEQLVSRRYWFCPPQHLHYFTPKSIRTIAEPLGLRCLRQFGDFPIELFLLHSDSNYVNDPTKGPKAHQARLALDVLLLEQSLTSYLDFATALTGVGLGRNTATVLEKYC